jgi:DNA polymerase-1
MLKWLKMNRLVLIDGHAILHRAYYALPRTLTTRKGELVNAVYGFARMLLRVIADLKPSYTAVAFDTAKPTFRQAEYIGYQVQRPKMDEELKGQIGRVHEIVRALNLPIFEVAGYEADDVIGTLARQAIKKKVEAIIVTGDQDLLQLVESKIKVYAPVKGFSQTILFDKKKVRQKLGIDPGQIIDYKALVGDASDNYPGVPGIGPKTAVELLSRFKSLKQIYKNLDKLKPRVAGALTKGAEAADLSQKLARIVTDVPIKLNLKACQVHDYDHEKASKLFEELEFRSLIEKLPGVESRQKHQKRGRKKTEKQLSLV